MARRMKALGLGAFVLALLVTGPALALDQKEHRSISQAVCLEQGLDANFCELVGTAAYNVDSNEWSDLPAHAQAAEGQNACDAANDAAKRVALLTSELRAQFVTPGSAQRATSLAIALGRTLHTLQDDCAHDGQPNTQHAWASLSDTCEDTNLSPDTQHEAITCASIETKRAMSEFTDALWNASASSDGLSDVEANAHWPARGDVCTFLDSADSWDGIDRRWNHDKMVSALGSAFALGISGLSAPTNLCQNDSHALDRPNPAPRVDTSQGADYCWTVNMYCVGKADEMSAAPPWVRPETPAPAPTTSESSAGCSLAARSPSPLPAWLLASLLVLARRRRRA